MTNWNNPDERESAFCKKLAEAEDKIARLEAENAKLLQSLPVLDNRTRNEAESLLGQLFRHYTDEISFSALPYLETRDIVVGLLAENKKLREDLANIENDLRWEQFHCRERDGTIEQLEIENKRLHSKIRNLSVTMYQNKIVDDEDVWP